MEPMDLILRQTFIGKQLVAHSDVVGASPVGAAPTTIFIVDLTPGFNGLGKDNCKTRPESFKFWNLVCIRGSAVVLMASASFSTKKG